MQRCNAILLIGPTGSGKTPLGECLERTGLWGGRCAHLDFGACLRRAANGAAPAGALAASETRLLADILATGRLLADGEFPLAARLLGAFIAERALGPDDWLVLNGLPRHPGQARDLQGFVRVGAVVYLECTAEVVWERIRSNVAGDRAGRTDDAPAAIERKLCTFRDQTAPLVDHYQARGVPVATLTVTAATTPASGQASLAAWRLPR